MPTVVIEASSYDYNILKPQIFSMLDHFAATSIVRNSTVIIKPNLLAPAPPEKAILTHPLVVRATAEYVLDKGARPVISDSNAMGSFEKVLKAGGFTSALKGLDVKFREFRESSIIDVGEPFGKIEIATDALEADALINLPKLKTHSQMLLTLGVKNLFGCIVGIKKPEWHFRTGVDREMFARLLIKIHDSLRPAATILDGVLAMEGQGPGKSGRPRSIGVVMGSDSAVALDMAVCRTLGIPPEELPTNKIALESRDFGDIEIQGELPEIKNFELPSITPLVFGPPYLHGFIRKHLVQRPIVNNTSCVACGQCWKYCPAQAISADGKKINFDYEKCIRCYCCIEICPQGALSAKETLAGKAVRNLLGRKR
ncbi:MAG TPA: DUF362 domain-containing protein [Dissulfurispiraceae bacterium]|nr:DUF362 domain-containing protein [Dissulfurispiraceae bacterium]